MGTGIAVIVDVVVGDAYQVEEFGEIFGSGFWGPEPKAGGAYFWGSWVVTYDPFQVAKDVVPGQFLGNLWGDIKAVSQYNVSDRGNGQGVEGDKEEQDK
jgi:hypothetical protein